jgi:hypothetical protein
MKEGRVLTREEKIARRERRARREAKEQARLEAERKDRREAIGLPEVGKEAEEITASVLEPEVLDPATDIPPDDVIHRAEQVLQETTLTVRPIKYGDGAYLQLHRSTQDTLEEEYRKQEEVANALVEVSQRITTVYQAELSDAISLLKKRADRRRGRS